MSRDTRINSIALASTHRHFYLSRLTRKLCLKPRFLMVSSNSPDIDALESGTRSRADSEHLRSPGRNRLRSVRRIDGHGPVNRCDKLFILNLFECLG